LEPGKRHSGTNHPDFAGLFFSLGALALATQTDSKRHLLFTDLISNPVDEILSHLAFVRIRSVRRIASDRGQICFQVFPFFRPNLKRIDTGGAIRQVEPRKKPPVLK
jgi:hypothetical protein